MTGFDFSLTTRQLAVEPHGHVDFGVGAVERVAERVSAVEATRAFLVTDRGLRATGVVDRVLAVLATAGIETDVYDGVDPNPSTDNIDRAAEQARGFGRAAVVAVGGGSTLDAAKGIALVALNPGAAADYDYRNIPDRPGLPIVAIPTTSGTGAETNGFGVIEDRRTRRKVYIGHRSVRPRYAILDPELTVGLPPRATAATGMDALVHGIESLASKAADPLSVAYANEAIALVGSSLRDAVADGTDLEPRARLMFGSHLAGLALSLSGLGLVHGIAHSVTNHTGAVHGLALSAVLEEVMVRTTVAARPAYASTAAAMGVGPGDPVHAEEAAEAAVAAVRDLADDVGARLPLRALGVERSMIPAIAAGALADSVSSNHPRPFDQEEVEELLRLTL